MYGLGSFSLFDFILDLLLWPRWSPWTLLIDWLLFVFGYTDDDGIFLPRKKKPRLRKGTAVYEWQVSVEEASEWIRRDLKANLEWMKFRDSIGSCDVIYTYTGLDQDGEQTQGLAVVRGNKCLWRRAVCIPFDPEQIETSLRAQSARQQNPR